MTVTASGYARVKNEFYQTEPWATEALLRQLAPEIKEVWEPAAGNHLISDTLKRSGRFTSVITSDIATYDLPHSNGESDFLSERYHWNGARRAIITNPPYGRGNRTAVKFIEKALSLCDGHVAMLLTAKFDFGKTRRHLFADNPRFVKKVALLDRLSLTLDGVTGTEDHAWYVWGPEQARPRSVKGLFYEGKVPA